ncbi:branched-chain amino acid ABC transporter permease [Parvibaculum sp.]|uniref:branched-chain amino acid ABC transporter permease n=1 Tax=Parvibaculum sp. TaxID=2024848 RepID=UPI001B1949A5|nr:branched-chain amino acid ABC transporter permease [Parvibaculum sp.]MBO6633405.1 branched-chain amino acid ABC transporter permease [Parvibaculum sp.]MBO6679342.1 branched-chain amino acid ABC transporter permease [Parvibaculum sp.]MBO6684634.1 branched-chain amino acid ABC transporter permease [Parvibaculum sp.]MBO6904545.1 branched-chain amino acid ABC transporter permease [Parvibaculum sp.]
MLDNLSLFVQYPPLAFDVVLNGLLIGAIFALAAYGMALVWGVLNIVNVVQGELVVLGGYVTFVAVQWGMPPLLGLPLSAAAMFCVGWLIYRAVIFRVVDRDIFISILATFGLSILIQQLANALFGSDVRTVDADLGSVHLFDGMVTLAGIKLLAFALALGAGGALWFFLRKARLGQAIRATAQDPRAARILGIDTDRVFAMTYALNAALCGAAGSLAVMAWTIHPYLGLPYTVRSFMVVVVAGVGNVAGVIAAGLGLGALENVAGFVFGVEFQIAFVFALMVIILVWRNAMATRKRSHLE